MCCYMVSRMVPCSRWGILGSCQSFAIWFLQYFGWLLGCWGILGGCQSVASHSVWLHWQWVSWVVATYQKVVVMVLVNQLLGCCYVGARALVCGFQSVLGGKLQRCCYASCQDILCCHQGVAIRLLGCCVLKFLNNNKIIISIKVKYIYNHI